MEPSSRNGFEIYEHRLETARSNFSAHPGISGLFSPSMDARLMHLFLIHFSALGVHMTEPVEHWISAAGKRCHDLGFNDLGRALQAHAKGEANHHLMLIEDTRKLAALWNSRYSGDYTAEDFLGIPHTPGVMR